MPIVPSLATALKATGNGAFQGMTRRLTGLVKDGEDLSTAFEQTGLFPEDYLHMVQVAESSGTVPETLHRLSPQFEDQARRSLMLLAAVMSWLVWLVVAAFIIFIIFSVVLTYVAMINDLANGKL
jgi:type IV pilus assembly protein PilC